MSKRSLSIAILLSTFFSPRIFSSQPLDDQKEGSNTPTHPLVATLKQIKVHDYTTLNNKNVNHILEHIEDVEEDLESDILTVNAKLATNNNQSPPLLLGAVLQHKQTHEYHQYLIADTGLLPEATQPKAVKRAHKARFHLIKATRGHVSLQLLEWLEISKYYSVTALHTNRPICHKCYLITYSLWKKKLLTNQKGCFSTPFPPLDKMPNLAQNYINTHLNLPLVQSLVVPMMGYVSKEEMNKSKQKNKEMTSFILSMQEVNNTQISILNKQAKTKNKQIQIIINELNNKSHTIETLTNQLKDKDTKLNDKNEQLTILKAQLQEKDKQFNTLKATLIKYQQELKNKDIQLDEKKYHIKMLYQEVNKKNNQLKEKEKIIPELLSIVQHMPKQPLNNKAKKKFLKAIRSNNVKKVTLFLDTYKDIVNASYQNKKTPFIFASEKGRINIAKLLKDQGANLNAKSEDENNALHYACLFSGSVEMVTWLLDECKISIETKGVGQKTPFICTAQKGQLAIAKLLKERGANLNAKGKDKNNALHQACLFSGSVDMVTWLLDVCKIDIETKGQFQHTPFLCAALDGQVEITKLLKQRGANVNAADTGGDNALHQACMLSGNVEMVTWLLDVCHIDIEAKELFQKTPFLFAAQKGKLAITKLLKQRGADINAKDIKGDNALRLAKKHSKNQEMIRYLQSLGLKYDL